METDFTHRQFTEEDYSRRVFERARWPDGPVCPRCGSVKNSARLRGERQRQGLWQCRSCRRQFSVRTGTVMERSKLTFCQWMIAVYRLPLEEQFGEVEELKRHVGVTYKVAWDLKQRMLKARNGEREFAPRSRILERVFGALPPVPVRER